MIDIEAIRQEAHNTATDLDRRYYSNDALQKTIVRLCRRLLDVADELDARRTEEER